MRRLFIAICVASTALSAQALAEDYGPYHAPTADAALPRYTLTQDYGLVHPYGLLPIRIYGTPQAGPYYNVPPYAVIAPY